MRQGSPQHTAQEKGPPLLPKLKPTTPLRRQHTDTSQRTEERTQPPTTVAAPTSNPPHLLGNANIIAGGRTPPHNNQTRLWTDHWRQTPQPQSIGEMLDAQTNQRRTIGANHLHNDQRKRMSLLKSGNGEQAPN